MRNYSNLANIFLLLFNILKRSPVVCILTIIVPLISGILTFFTFSAQSNLINTIVDSARLNMNEMIRLAFEGRMAEYLSNSLKDAPILRELKVYSAFDFFKGIWSDFVLKHYKRRYGVRKYEIKVGMILAIIQTTAIYVILLYLLDKMNESDQVTVGGISVLFLALLPIGGQIMALSLVQFVYRRI